MQGLPKDAGVFPIALLETPSVRNSRITPSFSSPREASIDPFGHPNFLPDALALTKNRLREVLLCD